jgi:hypothetical protein
LPPVDKYRLYFNEDDEIVEEALALQDSSLYSYFVDIPIHEESEHPKNQRI